MFCYTSTRGYIELTCNLHTRYHENVKYISNYVAAMRTEVNGHVVKLSNVYLIPRYPVLSYSVPNENEEHKSSLYAKPRSSLSRLCYVRPGRMINSTIGY